MRILHKSVMSYYCHCYDGYSGVDCSIGPLCTNNKKYCENGGVCKHVGDLNVKCLCPYAYRGNKCETHEFLNDENECNLSSKDSTTSDDSIDYALCSNKCLNDLNNIELCSCHQNNEIGRGRVRYEVALRLGNATIITSDDSSNDGKKKLNPHFAALLEKYISRFLRNSNISRINDLEIFSKTSSENDLTFHFFGVEGDSIRVREAINRMVEKGRIGNFSLVSTYYALHQEPSLLLQSLVASQKSPLREGDDLVLKCTAQGSAETKFNWFKNGFLLNATRSIRKFSIQRKFDEGSYTVVSVMRLNSTEQHDSGHYTCQASDWGLEICKSIKIEVLAPPSIRLEPPSVTMFRGESMRIRCIATQQNPTSERIGYSWTKNNALFHSDPQFEMWEDLYPDGSILTIQNIHKSATYLCTISNSLAPVSASIHVNIVDLELMSICEENLSYGIKWPATASGPPVLHDCPIGYSGIAQRYCEQQDYNKSEWLMPDFSDCINQKLLRISTEFKEITYGLQKTNASTLLRSCLEYVMNYYHRFLPGEGGYLLDLLQNIYEYSHQMDDNVEKEISSDVTLKIIDMILVNETSLNKETQVKKLQDLVQLVTINRESASFVLPSVVANPKSISSSAASISPIRQLKSLQIFKANIKTVPFSYQIYGDQLFSNQLYLSIDSNTMLTEATSNGSLTISIVTYKNLTYFLPKMYFSRNSYGTDINYIPASKIISSWLFYTNHTSKTTYLNLPLNSAHVEIIFHHENTPNNEWIPMCGYDSKATYDPSWRTDLCITENLMDNITRCICPISGTFVVLFVKKSFNVSLMKPPSVPMIVVICCGCCFLQSTIAFVILLPNIYIRRCYISINFAIMQFCLSISAMMSFIILGLLKFLPQEWYGLLSSSFAAILLLSSSTLVAIVLIIQSELEIETSSIYASMVKLANDNSIGGGSASDVGKMKKMSIKTSTTTTTPSPDGSDVLSEHHNYQASGDMTLHKSQQQRNAAMKFSNLSSTNRGIKSAIGLSWLLPILCAMCIPMIHKIMGHRSNEWWLEIASSDFIIFAITEILLVSLFMLLFITLLKHLIYLTRKYEKANTTLKKRINLLNRIAVLFIINFMSHTFYLIYLNTKENIFCYLFSISSILLGLMIILCFVIKVENYTVAETTSSSTKSSMKNSIDDFCTTTINNSLNFYQDMEKDNKSVPLRVFSNTMSNFPIDTKNSSSTTTTSIMQQQQQQQISQPSSAHRHPIHSRLTDIQMCSNDIIDLSSTQARPYELTKINSNMIYDVNNVISQPSNKSIVNNLDILKGISKDSIIGIRDNSLEMKKQLISPPIITLTNSDGMRASDSLVIDSVPDPDGMYTAISNDLDYLLNRTQEVPIVATVSTSHQHSQLPPPPPPVAFSNNPPQSTKSQPAVLLQHDVIIEESEHEVDS
ncbi:hypothetical protein PVAND_012018 [Polypedilum vanderplanki]|uniref:Uncharacterized protein n=1 Tax=Polypedilum vanderplanki TaxID=319348 RepID=A0A9J6CM19_POLVA|nr:hypothetical protein PVAND_012018 [Polypedilum vanderplanki]